MIFREGDKVLYTYFENKVYTLERKESIFLGQQYWYVVEISRIISEKYMQKLTPLEKAML